MMGSIFAGTEESPGKILKLKNKFYKLYRGMGLIELSYWILRKILSKKF